MAYKCLECGNIFDEGELKYWRERHGEERGGCPACNGEYEETKRCKICGGEFLEDELSGGYICEECLSEYRRDLDACYKIGEKSKESIEINSLFKYVFDVAEIEAILYNHIKENLPNEDFSSFIEDDKDWFAEKLYEEVMGI